MPMPFDKNKETTRPFRIWDASKRKHLIGRNYAHLHKAHDGALLMARWSRIDQALEVYDVRTGRLLGQYIRKEKSIGFIDGRAK